MPLRRMASAVAGRGLKLARAALGEARVHKLGNSLRSARIKAGLRTVDFRGVRLDLDPTSANSESVLAGRFERPLLDFVLARLQPGDVCVDVGAHVGYWTAPLAAAVGPTGKVVAIEAHEPNVVRLRGNLERNGLTNTEVIYAAAQEHPGIAELQVSGTSSSWNSLVSSGTYFPGSVKVVSVPAVSLDGIVTFPTIDLVKIDVEGAEQSVLAGAVGVLGRTRMLVLEIGGERVTPAGYVDAVVGVLFEHFDEVLAVDKSAGRLVSVEDAASLRHGWTDRSDVTKVVACKSVARDDTASG